MADTLLQNLTELTSPALTDLLYMVADPAGTPADHKVQFSTVLDRVKGFSKILDASGNGDYTSLATALADLSAGDVLFIRNGTYAGGVTISTTGVTIIGETRNGVIIQSPSNSSTPCITVSAANVTLQNFKIAGQRDTQGTGDADTTTWAGIRITGSAPIIDNVWVFEPYGHGISASANDGRITNCLVENRATNGATPTAGKYAYGIVIYGGSRWTIAYNRVTGWSQACGLWWGCSDNTVAFNRFISNYGYITGVAPGTRSACEDYGAEAINYRNIWIGNVIDGSTSECIECAQGVVGSQFISNVLTNANKFGDDTGRGFSVMHGGALQPTREIVFRNNTLIGDGATGNVSGGYFETMGALTIEGNTFIDCRNGATGVLIVGGANTRLTLRGNTFRGCDTVLRLSAQTPALVEGNSVVEIPTTSNAWTFYVADNANSSRHTFTANYIDAADRGITGFKLQEGESHRITQNTIVNMTGKAVSIEGVPYCTVTQNVVQGRAGANWGALVELGGAECIGTVVKHNIVSMDDYAIVLNAGPTHSVIQENTIIGGQNIWQNSGNTTNQIGPNHTGTFSRAVGVLKGLGAQTVNGTQATIAHGLAYTPTEVQITMTSAGTIWKSAASDGTNIYLTADTTGRTAEVFVR